MNLLQTRNLGHLLLRIGEQDEDDDDDDDEDEYSMFFGRRRRRRRYPKDPNRFPEVPSRAGTKLMRSGVFGANDYSMSTKKDIARRIFDRELGLGDGFQRGNNQRLAIQVSPLDSHQKFVC